MKEDLFIRHRNYGCRIREYNVNGIRHVSLENTLIRVSMMLDKGGDIVEFLYKPRDIDVMYRYPAALKKNLIPTVADRGGNFMDYYEGGWQELFPSIGASRSIKGAAIGMHGEASLLPWKLRIICDELNKVSIELSVSMVRTPYLLKKTLTILENETTLHIEEEVINESRQKLQFQWGHHPALGGCFLDETCEIILNGTPKIQAIGAELGENCPISPGQTGIWPLIHTKDGKELNLSQVRSMDSRLYMEFALCDMEEGAYIVKSRKQNLGFGMRWNVEQFPYIWVWQMFGGGMDYPFYGRAYTMALEPWNTLPEGVRDPLEDSGTIREMEIEPGGSIKTSLEAFIEVYPDQKSKEV